jgi:hypothetical protein
MYRRFVLSKYIKKRTIHFINTAVPCHSVAAITIYNCYRAYRLLRCFDACRKALTVLLFIFESSFAAFSVSHILLAARWLLPFILYKQLID